MQKSFLFYFDEDWLHKFYILFAVIFGALRPKV